MSASIWDAAPAPLQNCKTPTKLKFPTEYDALRKIERITTVKPLFVYVCGGCGWFHLTSSPPPKDTRRNRRPIVLKESA